MSVELSPPIVHEARIRKQTDDDAERFAQLYDSSGAVVINASDWVHVTRLSIPNTSPQNQNYEGTLGTNDFKIRFSYNVNNDETIIKQMWFARTYIFTVDKDGRRRMYVASMNNLPGMKGKILHWTTDPNAVPSRIKNKIPKESGRTYLEPLSSVSRLLGGMLFPET